MNYKLFFYLLLFSFILSCKQKKEQELLKIKKSDKNILVKHKTFTPINKTSSQKISSWQAYTNFEEFLPRFEETSPNEAFTNIRELRSLAKNLKDSLTIPKFKTPAFKARLNVLENEILRLEDMSSIPAITSKEVNYQIDKVFLVFSSLNEKINSVYQQEKLESEINLDAFFKIDSLK